MPLLFITPYYYPTSTGGIESQVRRFSQAISKKYKCVIVAPSNNKDFISFENKVKIYRTKIINPKFKDRVNFETSYSYIKRIIEKEKISRVIGHNIHTWISELFVEALFKVAKEKNIPVFLRVHNYTRDSRLLKEMPWKNYLCVSKSVAKNIIRHGAKKSKVKILYVPIDTSFFHPKKDNSIRKKLKIKNDEIVLLHASRIVGGKNTFDEKGIPELLKVFSLIKNEKTHLIISAAKTTKEKEKEFKKAIKKIKSIAKRRNIDDKVHVISSKQEEMPKVYNNADIFIMLSKIETFGGVYAEAMACGIPVIGTNVGGVPEVIVNKKTGFIIKNENEAISKLNLLIKNKKLRKKLGTNGRKHVIKNFEINKIITRLLKILKIKD